MNTDKELNDDALPFQSGMLEIQNQSNAQFCDPKIVHHLASFMVCDPVDDLRICDHRTKDNQVWNKFTNFNSAEKNWKPALLVESDLVLLESDCQGNLVDLFVQPMPDFVQNGERMPDNPLGFLP